MHIGIKALPGGDRVVRVEVLSRSKDLRDSSTQTNLHLTLQDEDPLGMLCAVELTPKAHGAPPQLMARASDQLCEHGFTLSQWECNGLTLELCMSTLTGVEHRFEQ